MAARRTSRHETQTGDHAAAGGEPLVFLPGTVCDDRLFAPLIEALGVENWITGPMSGGSSAADQARIVLEAAPARFALCGFSLGGIVALEIMAQAPERVTRLALIDTTPRPDPAANARTRRSAVKKAREHGMDGYILDAWDKLVSPANAADDALKATILAMAQDAGPDTLDSQTEIAINRADSRPRLAAIEVPTLIVAGEQEAVCPLDAHRELADGIPGARLVTIPDAGHFSPLENPAALAPHVRQWLGAAQCRTNPQSTDQGTTMSEGSNKNKGEVTKGQAEQVMGVERHDFVDLVPTDRPRSQSMRGFDEDYTDIVDYIVRCTHKIWDERDIGLIYTHYTHNCTVYTSMGMMYDRETVVRDTIQRLVTFPERRGMATHVIWRGDDEEGFYTSHMVTGSGRHSQNGLYGPATGRLFTTRTIADCMIYENKIYREWIVGDNMVILKQLGLDPHPFAEKAARAQFDKGLTALDIGENRRLIGQYPPEAEPDLELAHNDIERDTIQWMHEVFNRRMFGKMKDVYASNVQYHGPMLKELYGVVAITHQYLGLLGSIPDAAFMPQHVCSTPCEEGGTKVAVRWVMEGHHMGYGILSELGEPTGKRLQVMGITHYHYKNGKIVDEWNVYDELSLLVQIKLAQMSDAPLPSAEDEPGQ
ncbi:alpha/beta fold hydrolase [Cucumibacter marinus]|uniref:alpha/beta fold hydrolase n=1 Tax=Cucumibacter marinus TaxID=1121252 RepID=UPI0003FF14F5|nr:alpha/beta fold hydrolase [Cucumibacter marinus]